jgi:hypothetical protein
MRVQAASLVLYALACAFPRLVVGQGPPHKVEGIVIDSARVPIPDVEVAVIAANVVRSLATTRADGRFALGEFPTGPLSLRVRRLGFRERVVDVQVGPGAQSAPIEIMLTVAPTQLAEVAVEGDATGRLREFFQRREQRKAFGRFLAEAEIQRMAPTNSSDLFRSVPGIVIRASATEGNTIRVRNCQPTVWVDGQRVPGAELDEVARPGDIAAIEFYASSAGIPAQYMDRQNRLCGLILVWMKNR